MKQISQETWHAMVNNRYSASKVTDGTRFVTINGAGTIHIGEMVHCTGTDCRHFGFVNGGSVDASTPEAEFAKMPFIFAPERFVGDGIGCYDADGSGDVLCPGCTIIRDEKAC